jgi:hypothetical protein
MPTSTYAHVAVVASFLERTRPESVLDVGVGNGKMGFIVRDLLDVMLGGRHRSEDWLVRLDGIEAFGEYVQAHQRAIYNEIHLGDAVDLIDRLGSYDVIILGDVLEHFERGRAEAFFERCFAHARAIILNIPLGERWTQDAIYGNPHERHLSFWKWEDFAPFACRLEAFEFETLGSYGCFLIERVDYLHHRARQDSDALAGAGRIEEALSGLEQALQRLGRVLATELQIAEFLVQQGDFGLAARRLGESTILFPDAAASLAPQVEQLNGLALADDRQLRAAGPGGQLDLSQS